MMFHLFLLSCLLAPAKPPEELLRNICELEAPPPALIVLKNTLPEAAQRNWIRVTLRGAPGISTCGAVVELQTREQTQRAVILSGDSFMCPAPGPKTLRPGNQERGPPNQSDLAQRSDLPLQENPESNLGHLVKAKDLQDP